MKRSESSADLLRLFAISKDCDRLTRRFYLLKKERKGAHRDLTVDVQET